MCARAELQTAREWRGGERGRRFNRMGNPPGFVDLPTLPKEVRENAIGALSHLSSQPVLTLGIEPGSPWENGYSESFNGKLRDEVGLVGAEMAGPDDQSIFKLLSLSSKK